MRSWEESAGEAGMRLPSPRPFADACPIHGEPASAIPHLPGRPAGSAGGWTGRLPAVPAFAQDEAEPPAALHRWANVPHRILNDPRFHPNRPEGQAWIAQQEAKERKAAGDRGKGIADAVAKLRGFKLATTARATSGLVVASQRRSYNRPCPVNPMAVYQAQ